MASNSAANFFKLSASALIAATALTFSATSFAAPENNLIQASVSYKQAHKIQTEKHTLALANLMRDYRKASKVNKQNIKRELIALATERQALLAELIATDPAAAVRAVLPVSVRKGMPEDVKAMLAEKRELQGDLEVTYEDYEDESKSRLRHTLITDSGRIELHLPVNANAAALQTGVKVRAKGWLFNDNRKDSKTTTDLVLNDEPESLLLLADGSTTTTSFASTTTVLPNTLGEQKTLVMLLNFQDSPDEQPWTIEQVQNMVFGTVNDYYQEASYGQTWLSGDVQGYYTLPMSASCDSTDIDNYAMQRLTELGVDEDLYDRVIYLFPQNSNCGWSGKGTVGGSPSKSWINGSLSLRTVGHELGHNFGLHHAKKLECAENVLTGDCYTVEYGDSLDIMGRKGVTGHFNAVNKDLLGWLNDATAAEIITAEHDGSFVVEAYEVASAGGAKGLKIRRGNDSASGEKLWYYVEYRQPLGFDSYLSAYPDITAGALIHSATEQDVASSQLLDMTPNSVSADWNDAVLPVGVSYTDVNAGVTITTESVNENSATINVSYSGLNCTKEQPLLTLLVNENGWVTAGSTVNYSATVTNTDSQGCADSNYNVTADIPGDWSVNGNDLTLAPGESGSVTVSIVSSTAAVDGFYDISIHAQNSNDSIYNNTSIVSYVVDTPIEVCISSAPQLFMSVDNSGEILPGSTVTYWAQLTNLDSNCPAATFSVIAELADGWSSNNANITLGAGETTSFTLELTSPTSVINGEYQVAISAINTADVKLQNTASVIYNVTGATETCTPASPTIEIIDESNNAVVAGSNVNYSVLISNQASAGCSNADFDVFVEQPADWQATNSQVHLAPGESTAVNITIGSSVATAEGLYEINIYAQSVIDTSVKASAQVNYTVLELQPVNSAPVASRDDVILTAKEATLIDVLANDWDPDNDLLSMTLISQGAKGSVQIMASGELLYTPAKNFKTSDSFSYTISDGELTSTATVNVRLVSSDGDTGNGGNKGKGKK